MIIDKYRIPFFSFFPLSYVLYSNKIYNKIYNISPADASGQVVEYDQWVSENIKIQKAILSLNDKLQEVINCLK